MASNNFRFICIVIYCFILFVKVKPQCSGYRWAPMRIKKPFISFLNDVNCPNWQTTNSFTKKSGALLNILIPKNVPFAVACGACFDPTNLSTNLSITISDQEVSSYPIYTANRKIKHSLRLNECLISYALTDQITRPGKMTCSLSIGNKIYKDYLYFKPKWAKIVESTDVLQDASIGDMINCPVIPKSEMNDKKSNPIVRTWHIDPVPEDAPQILFKSMSPKVAVADVINNKYILDSFVSCSVYMIDNPTKVWRSRFRLLNVKSSSYLGDNSRYSHLPSDNDTNLNTSKLQVSWLAIGIIVASLITTTVLVVVGAHKCVFSRSKLANVSKKNVDTTCLNDHDGSNYNTVTRNTTLDICNDIPPEDRPFSDSIRTKPRQPKPIPPALPPQHYNSKPMIFEVSSPATDRARLVNTGPKLQLQGWNNTLRTEDQNLTNNRRFGSSSGMYVSPAVLENVMQLRSNTISRSNEGSVSLSPTQAVTEIMHANYTWKR